MVTILKRNERRLWLNYMFIAICCPILADFFKGFGAPTFILSIISFVDELFVISLLLVSLFIYRNIKIELFEIILFLFLLIGFISCINNSVPLYTSLLGAFNIVKAVFVYICFKRLFFSFRDLIYFFKLICFLFPLLFFSEIIEILVPNFRNLIGFTTAQPPVIRAGIKPIYGFFRPTQITFIASTVFFIYTSYFSLKRHSVFYRYICVAMNIMTLKVKDNIAFIMSLIFSTKKRINNLYVGVAGALFVVLFYLYSILIPDHYNHYFESQDEYSNARVALVYTSAKILRDYFPFGVGFGRFASSTTEHIKSPVYHQYGIDMVWGLDYDSNSNFVDDCFWPMIFGETGALGTLIYITLLYLCFSPYLTLYLKNTKNLKVAFVAQVFIFMLISSLAKATLNGPPQSLLLWGGAGMFHYMAFEKEKLRKIIGKL